MRTPISLRVTFIAAATAVMALFVPTGFADTVIDMPPPPPAKQKPAGSVTADAKPTSPDSPDAATEMEALNRYAFGRTAPTVTSPLGDDWYDDYYGRHYGYGYGHGFYFGHFHHPFIVIHHHKPKMKKMDMGGMKSRGMR